MVSEPPTARAPSAPPRQPLGAEVVQRLQGLAQSLSISVPIEEVAERGAIWGWVGPIKVAAGVRFVGGRPVGYAHFAEAEDALLGPVSVEPWTAQAQGRQLCGDEAADATLSLRGDRAVVLAWMDAATRAQLVKLFSTPPLSLRLAGCRATLRGPETLDLSVDALVAQIEALVGIVASARLRSGSVLDRAVHNALEDPVRDVREANAAVVGALIPSTEEPARTQAAARLLLSPEVSLDHRLDLLRMMRGLPESQVLPLMQTLLEEGPLELVRRAVTWAEESQHPDTVRPLIKVLHRFEDLNLVRGVAGALCSIADPKAQPALLNLLAREDPALRAAVIEGLGGFAGRDALPQILPFTKGLFVDRELKRVARAAVERIQARVTPED